MLKRKTYNIDLDENNRLGKGIKCQMRMVLEELAINDYAFFPCAPDDRIRMCHRIEALTTIIKDAAFTVRLFQEGPVVWRIADKSDYPPVF